MRQLLLICILFIGIAYCIPTFPEWPQQFEQDFSEDFVYGPFKSSTQGKFTYDYTNKSYRISRNNGRADRYCGFNGLYFFRNTPCEQIVVNGDRYLHYPERNDCCYCCSNEHGCGMLKPQWMNNSTFVEETTFNGQPAYKWNKRGMQNNFYIETKSDNPQDRIMLQIDQQPNDIQTYNTTRTASFEPITLPSICQKEKKCSLISVCQAVRMM